MRPRALSFPVFYGRLNGELVPACSLKIAPPRDKTSSRRGSSRFVDACGALAGKSRAVGTRKMSINSDNDAPCKISEKQFARVCSRELARSARKREMDFRLFACVNVHFLTLEFPDGELNRASGDADVFSESARARKESRGDGKRSTRDPKVPSVDFSSFFFFFSLPFRSD